MNLFRLAFPAIFSAAFASNAFSFTLEGDVKNKEGAKIAEASVELLQKGLQTKTDVSGHFKLSDEKETALISQKISANQWQVQNRMLFVEAPFSNSLQIRIFDLNGIELLSQRGTGAMTVDLQKLTPQAMYVAKISNGNSHEIFRFSPAVNSHGKSKSVENSSGKIFKKEAVFGDTLRIIAENFDTLQIPLANLDTTLELTLSEKAPAEEKFAFGWAKKNAPVPTRGCGKSWNRVKSGSYDFYWSQGKRTIRIDIPENYDNQKPYRLVFGMHCMGGWAGGVRDEGYYGLKPLDSEMTTIFVAPEGNGNQAPWAQPDYTLFDELLADLESNLCIDSSRVFIAGFSYGSMFTNGLSRNHQDVVRAVAVYETADVNIWLPEHSGKPIAWMGVLGLQDDLCKPEMGRSARNTALTYASAAGKDATKEQAEEYPGYGNHICYNYKDVDVRFPVRWCTQNGGHIWNHKDPGAQTTWVPVATWDFFTQF